MISQALQKYLEKLLQEKFDVSSIRRIEPVSGGSVNETFALLCEERKFFLKINDKEAFPQMFEKEAEGLQILKEKSKKFYVPNPLLKGEYEAYSYLLMEYIDSIESTTGFWQHLGEGLAELHQNTSKQFGLGYDNYNGSLVQHNSPKEDWSTFFIENRLMQQEKLARDNRRIDATVSTHLNALYSRIEELFPQEPPSLLHGDLWSGNFMVGVSGEPVIIDPAIYYGHREMDIAMTLLFGGFNKTFYQTYQRVLPLAEGWESRVDLCNLYPLLIHVNLFGQSYALRIASVLKRMFSQFS